MALNHNCWTDWTNQKKTNQKSVWRTSAVHKQTKQQSNRRNERRTIYAFIRTHRLIAFRNICGWHKRVELSFSLTIITLMNATITQTQLIYYKIANTDWCGRWTRFLTLICPILYHNLLDVALENNTRMTTRSVRSEKKIWKKFTKEPCRSGNRTLTGHRTINFRPIHSSEFDSSSIWCVRSGWNRSTLIAMHIGMMDSTCGYSTLLHNGAINFAFKTFRWMRQQQRQPKN